METSDIQIEVDDKTADPEKNDLEVEQSQDEQLEKKSNDDLSTKSDHDEGLTTQQMLKEYLPLILCIVVGVVLLIVAIVLFTSSGGSRKISISKINMPAFQGSVKVLSVDGKSLKYTKNLKYIGSVESRSLRHKVEPKLLQVYKKASFDANSVLTLAFKYGGAGDSKTISARSSATTTEDGVVVVHWVFLKANTTISQSDALNKLKTAIQDSTDIVVDSDSVSLTKLENFTRTDTIKLLSQYGFLKDGLKNLDMRVLAVLGLINGPQSFGIQSEGDDEGLCPGLNKPMFGHISPADCMKSKKTYLGMSCMTECGEGSEIVGSSLQICLSSGVWSGQSPSCQARCSPLSGSNLASLHPPSCAFQNMSVGDLCFLQCQQSSRLHFIDMKSDSSASSYFRECLSSGEWSGGYGFCKAICPKIIKHPHQTTSPSSCLDSPVEGDVCITECDTGYVLDAGGTTYQMVCDVSGRWDQEFMKCQKKCQKIMPHANQNVMPDICTKDPYNGIKCKYSCDLGYELIGDDMSDCMSDGTWSVEQPECVRTCDSVPDIMDGFVQTDSGSCQSESPSAGSECSVLCKWGYVSTMAKATCSSTTGQWSNDIGTCQRSCGKVLSTVGVWSPSSCSLKGHHEGHSFCSLTCPPSFDVSGNPVIQCNMMSGMWNSTPGFCSKTCPGLSAPSNGMIDSSMHCTSSVIAKTACKFSCDAGFTLNGDKTLTCMHNGMWSSSPPTCSEAKQFFIQHKSEQQTFCLVNSPDGKIVKIFNDSCSSNEKQYHWFLLGAHNIQNVLSGLCIASSNSFVHMSKCNTSEKSQYLSSMGQYKVVNNQGFFLVAGHRTTSKLLVSKTVPFDVQWRFINVSNHNTLTLYGARTDASCLPLDDTANEEFSNACKIGVQMEGTLCNVVCKTGYKLVGMSNVIECMNGAWNISEIMCEPNGTYVVQCPSLNNTLSTTPNTCVNTLQSAGAVCGVSCMNENKYLDGPDTLVCDESGKWIPDESPMCRDYCRALFPQTNSYYISTEATRCWNGKARSGDTCGFQCNMGYMMMGEPLLTCTDLGIWDNMEPTCFKICDMMHVAADVTVSCDMSVDNLLAENSTCDFACPAGFEIAGESSMTCMSSGKWNITETPHCVETCPLLSNLSDILIDPLDCGLTESTVGTTCKLTCMDGYFMSKNILVETISLMCKEKHLWSGHVPHCVQACPSLNESMDGQTVQPSSCISDSQPVGTKCTHLCLSSTLMNNVVTSTCLNDGTWSFDGQLNCSEKCEALAIPKHASVLPDMCSMGFVDQGTICDIQCPMNMDTMGSSIRVCLGYVDVNTGLRWSGLGSTVCVQRCPMLHTPPNTRVFPQYCSYRTMVEGETCSFECDRNFYLNGPNILRCLESGVWSDSVPMCLQYCPASQPTNGYMTCFQDISPYSPQGFMHIPGTECTLVCDPGYTPIKTHKIKCRDDGTWSEQPICEQVSETFSILQQIDNKTTCLVAQAESMAVYFVNSSESCISSGNTGLWYWMNDQIKNVGTGLCLSAKDIADDSGLTQMPCYLTVAAQQWNCDVFFPYRIIIKNTAIGIDSTYMEAGPMLQMWTHAESYWITFNEDLETTATICSQKATGTCPAIVGDNLSVEPSICGTDKVEAWQSCRVVCQANNAVVEGIQCLPTGNWKGIDGVTCKHACPALTDTKNKILVPSRCSLEDMEHLGTCSVSCTDGTQMSNGETQTSLLCEDGKWSEPDMSCENYCDMKPASPNNGTVSCENGTCKAMCNPGFSKVGTNDTVMCQANGEYSGMFNVQCEFDILQFRIQALAATSLGLAQACLSVMEDNDILIVIKETCSASSMSQYWKWKENSLQNVQTGKCMSVSSPSYGSIVALLPCHDNMQQKWSCLSNHHPYHVTSHFLDGFIDYGGVSNSAAVLYNGGEPSSSGEWIGIQTSMMQKTICSFMETVACAPLIVGPTSTANPPQCAQSQSQESQSCTVTCKPGYMTSKNGTLTCLSTGLWDKKPPECLSKTALSGSCPPIKPPSNLKVNYQCLLGETVPSGTLCGFTCAAGYYLNGPEYIFCNSTGLWTGNMPECKAFCFGLFPAPHSMLPASCLTLHVPAGEVCTQTCKEGYASPDQDLTRTCKMDGVWSSKPINCQSFCPAPGANDSAVVKLIPNIAFESTKCMSENHFPESKCIASCQNGFFLDGNAEITCQSNGTWHVNARCIEKFNCPEPSGVGVLSSKYTHKQGMAIVPGTTLMLTCQNGYHPDGDMMRVCQSNGNWSGYGPQIPGCAQNCPPLSSSLGDINPATCTTESATEGQICILQCPDNSTMSREVKCVGSQWIDSNPVCTPYNLVNNSEVVNEKQGFLIITREPNVGCLSITENNTVSWMEKSLCDPQQPQNKWKWMDEKRIMNLKNNMCMTAVASGNKMLLGVGSCTSSPFYMNCGNPKSSNQRMAVYASTDRGWRMQLDFNLTTSLPNNIVVEELSDEINALPRNLVDTLWFSANDDIEYSQSLDKPICSYMCGGTISEETKHGFILSPGYTNDKHYPSNMECEWLLLGYKTLVTLTVVDLNLEMSTNPMSCSSDCLEIYKGSNVAPFESELVQVFSGQSLSSYGTGGNVIHSATGNILVKFTSNTAIENKGFALKFEFNEITSPGNCGKPSNVTSSNIQENSIVHFPWLVSIKTVDPNTHELTYICYGALVNENTILTAAHCSKVMGMKPDWENTVIDVGNLSFALMEKSSDFLSIKRIFMHPGYDRNTRQHNFAMWKLSKSLMVNWLPCLPTMGFTVHVPQGLCYAIGQMKLKNEMNVNEFVQFPMNIDSSSWCQAEFGLSNKHGFICANNHEISASSKHSEPLICSFNNMWYVVGIASHNQVGLKTTRRLYASVQSDEMWFKKFVDVNI